MMCDIYMCLTLSVFHCSHFTVSFYLSHALHANLMEVVLVPWGMGTVGTFNLGISGLLWVNFHIF
jgi:hypothetical protein